jgi:hypothetical protein
MSSVRRDSISPGDQSALELAADASTLGAAPWRRFFGESLNWSYSRRRKLQLHLLRAVSAEFGLGIEDWSDFDRRKLTAKTDLVDFPAHHIEGGVLHQTSGSSGRPFEFYRDRSLEPIDAAIFDRAWNMIGRRNEPVLRLVSGEPKWKFYDALRNVFPMNYRTVDDSYVDWVVRHRPYIIHGVAGAIHDLVERVWAAGQGDALRQTALVLMSEDTQSHRRDLQGRVGRIFMGYGNSEVRTVASECRFGTLHVNMETAVAETVDGRLYVTNLFSKTMPFVRYTTGDRGEVVPHGRCPCGVESDVIEGLVGKAIDYYNAPGFVRPLGWWLVSPISHEYGGVLSAWRLEVIPAEKLVRLYAVPKGRNLRKIDPYLRWITKNTHYRAEVVPVKELPDWREKLIRVVDP